MLACACNIPAHAGTGLPNATTCVPSGAGGSPQHAAMAIPSAGQDVADGWRTWMKVTLSDMREIKLSVCIATLNRGAFLGATLESIICQATDEVEIVVLDGASTDNTGDVIRQYQECFPRLRYFRQNAN